MPIGFIMLIILISISTLGWLFSIIVLPIAHKFNKLKQFDTIICMNLFGGLVIIFDLWIRLFTGIHIFK